MWPDFGHVEDVDGCVGDGGRVDCLDVDVPGREIAGADGVLKVLEVVIRIRAGDRGRFGVCKVVDPLVGKEVDADVMV